MFGQSISVDWDDPSLEFVRQTVLKKYCSLIRKSGSLSGLPMFYGYRRLNKLLVPRVEDAIKSCIA
jgi:hypothetical protein